MALKADLNQRLTTGLTPQLQQAIRLLPMSSLELAAEVQFKLDSNPLLEREDEFGELDTPATNEWNDSLADDGAYGDSSSDEPLYSPMSANSTDDTEAHGDDWRTQTTTQTDAEPENFEYEADASDYLNQASFDPDDFTHETDDSSDGFEGFGSAAGQADQAEQLAGQTPSTSSNLQDHVRWQMNFKHLSDLDGWLAEQLIDSMDERGFIELGNDELYQRIQTTVAFYQISDIEIELADIESVVKRIQTCEPIGVGARNLAECLDLQLARLPSDTPFLAEARQLLADPSYLNQLVDNQLPTLLKATGMTLDSLKGVLNLLRTLDPNPATTYQQSLQHSIPDDGYDIPDVLVTAHHSATSHAPRWQVRLNPETLPRLRINRYYASLIRRADTSAQNLYLKDQLNDARLFMRAIEERNQNLLNVARCIVRRQQGFFEQGVTAMQPMVLRDVAEEVGLHESTVSRITTSKTMLTPRGLFPLKYFFSSQVGADGEGVSSTAISALIKQMISEEDPKRPLSDNAIVERLKAQDIQIARRTVTKYREAMNIASSSARKQRL